MWVGGRATCRITRTTRERPPAPAPCPPAQGLVRLCMGYLPSAPDKAMRVEMIKTLQGLTEGKVGAVVWVQLSG